MSPSREPRRDALDFVNELLAEEEDEALADLTPNARHAAMRARGIDPSRAQALLDQVLAEHEAEHKPTADEREPSVADREPLPAQGPVQATDAVDIRSRRRTSWLAFAIAAGVAITAGAVARPAIVAWLTPAPPPGPAPTIQAPPPDPTPEHVASVLRRDALAACAKGDFPACESGLDRAKESDPAGEEDARVREARSAIRRAKLVAPPMGPKPQ
jgi:hypothetical protein